jgi:UDP-N-acetyl-D-mannosaminuronic acid transferase (WecB/TagA/CpsF family)
MAQSITNSPVHVVEALTGVDNGVDVQVGDGSDIALGTTTGTKIGTSASQKLGFYGATPIAQRAGAAQAAVATTPATNSTPYGYAEAQANAIVALVNELRAALVAVGLIKGAA